MHTNGPWIDDGDNIGVEITVAGEPVFLTICRIENPGLYLTTESEVEEKSNKRLILAAPELLAALKWMTDEFLCHVNFNPAGGDSDAFHAYINQARLVIAKAEGRID